MTTLVPRDRLMKLLDGLSKKRIIYMHAPAGFGKTVSALLWLEHRKTDAGMRQSLISLDEYDNKTAEFCKRLVSALAGFQPENAELRELAGHPAFQKDPVEFVRRSLSAFGGDGDGCTLIIDDLHIISNDEILRILPILLKRFPDRCVILLISRAAPPDAFSQLVMKDEIAVVDAGHLMFGRKEIMKLFAVSGRPLTDRQAADILASTGGWAIGIRALLLSEGEAYSINLTGQYLENYLKTHVWERWDAATREFMTLVSVADELTADICACLTADNSPASKLPAGEMLRRLTRENAFLRAIGNDAYRFHDLFRGFAFHMLEARGEETLNRQWSRLGEHYYGEKDYFRAVEYFLKGKNDGGVAKSLYLMYEYDSPYASIEDTLGTVRSSVTPSLVEQHPFLLEVQSWAAWIEGRADDCERHLDKYYGMFPGLLLKSPRSAITLILLRCVDYRESFVHTMKTLRKIPFKGNVKAYTPSITNNMPFFHRSVRDFSEIGSDLETNIALFDRSVGLVIGAESAVIRECLYAGFLYEAGSLHIAYDHAVAACAAISDGCSAEIRFCAMMILAEVQFSDGQKAEAEKTIRDVRAMIDENKAFYLNTSLETYLAGQQFADGDRAAAEKYLEERQYRLDGQMRLYMLNQYFEAARAHIVVGDYSAAILILQKLLDLCERYRRPLDIIETRILLAAAYWKKGRGGQRAATGFLEGAISKAYEYGYTQIFAKTGADLVTMLHKSHKRSIQKDYSGEVPAAFVKSLYITSVTASARFKGLSGGSALETPVFTDKQKTVMRLMREGRSRKEIAEAMGLKPYGVKTHMELIYKKLDVPNSVQAVMRINELRIFEDG